MAEFEEKLNRILSSPEAMAQVAALAQSLGDGETAQAPAEEDDPSRAAPPASDSGLGGLLGSLDPGMLQRFLPMLGELNSPRRSEREQLLYALRPFLKESRRDKIDKALQMARILHLGKQFLGTLGE